MGRLGAFLSRNLGGISKTKGGQLATSWDLGYQWRGIAALQYKPSRYDDRDAGDGASIQRSAAAGLEAGVSSDPDSELSLKLVGQAQRINGGHNLNAEAALSWRALPRLRVDLVPQANYTAGEPRYVGRGEMQGEYLFGALTAQSVGATFRSTVTMAPGVSLHAAARWLKTVGDYDSWAGFQSSAATQSPLIELRRLGPTSAPMQANPDFDQKVWTLDFAVRWDVILGTAFYFEYLRGQMPNYGQIPLQTADANQGSVRRVPVADVVMLKLHCSWK